MHQNGIDYMKKKILFISPAFANGGVIYKYDCRYLESWGNYFDFVLASVTNTRTLPIKCETLWSHAILPHLLKLIQSRYFKGYEPLPPDISRYTISPFLKKKCAEYVERHKIDVIHTVSFPCSSHLIGLWMKKKYGIPWVAHFYDPWVDNPLRNISQRLRGKDMEMEREVAENADAIIHSNDVIRQCWIERYGEAIDDKIHIIPFGYAQSQMHVFKPITDKLPHGDKIVLSYIGTCAGDRNFQSLIKATYKFSSECPNLRDRLDIKLLGNLLPIDKDLIEQYKLADIIDFVGRVPSEKLGYYFVKSDVFLVIDSPQTRNVFFPSKLIDYFYYQKPILGISPKIGVTNLFLKESGNHCFENNDIQGIANYLKMLVNNFDTVMDYDRNYYKKFAPEAISMKYQKVIKKITQ